MRQKHQFVCSECGHQYDEVGNGNCFVCGGSILSIDEVGEGETAEYPKNLMKEAEDYEPEDLADEQL